MVPALAGSAGIDVRHRPGPAILPPEVRIGVVQVRLPDEIQAMIDRQVAEGRVADASAFLAEAARRYAEELELEAEFVSEAKGGIADIEAGRFRTVATREDLAALEAGVMARVRERLART
jgi:antitoxin ParD1/3/4